MRVRLLHSRNASGLIIVTPFGILTFARFLQPLNTSASIIVTPFGISTLVRLLQLRNAPYPMLVTPSGIFIAPLRVGFDEKAESPIVLRLLGTSNVTVFSCCPAKALSPICSTFTPFIVAGILISLGALGSELYPTIVLVLSLNMK